MTFVIVGPDFHFCIPRRPKMHFIWFSSIGGSLEKSYQIATFHSLLPCTKKTCYDLTIFPQIFHIENILKFWLLTDSQIRFTFTLTIVAIFRCTIPFIVWPQWWSSADVDQQSGSRFLLKNVWKTNTFA